MDSPGGHGESAAANYTVMGSELGKWYEIWSKQHFIIPLLIGTP